ncbi:MAG: phosphotransferase [Geminicoccaceae bacterium]
MSTRDALEAARALVATVPGWAGREPTLRPGVAPVASPMNQGVDATSLRAWDAATGESLWVKIADPDAALFADPASVVAAAREAGTPFGVGPEVVAADPLTGDLVMRDLAGSHRTATLNCSPSPPSAMPCSPPCGPSRPGPLCRGRWASSTTSRACLRPAQRASPCRPTMPGSTTSAPRPRPSGPPADTVPAHGDGNASNVMIDEAGGVLLVDFDLAANRDPFEDLGSFLVEANTFDPAARESFEAFHGRFDERLFNRSRLYGVADDLRWGLIGAILARTSARTDLEFLKYAEWRFLRCRMAMRDQRFEERKEGLR